MKKVTAIILLIMSFSAIAEGFKSESETKAFADGLMQKFVNKNFSEALNSAKPYWPIPELEVDGLLNTILQQWTIVDSRFGQGIGQEFIRQEKIANSFVRYYYLHKFENHAIYWSIEFYRPRNEWKLNSIQFLDDLESLYQ